MSLRSFPRVEPRLLRTPSTLRNFSTYISNLSSYIPKEPDPDAKPNILCARFVSVEWAVGNDAVRSVLFLGSYSGLSVWNVTDIDNIRLIGGFEIGCVVDTDVVSMDKGSGPNVAAIVEKDGKRWVTILSMKSGKCIENIKFSNARVLSLKVSDGLIAMLLSNGNLALYSCTTLKQLIVLGDVLLYDEYGSIFDICSSWIVYATTSPVSTSLAAELAESLSTSPEIAAKAAGKVAKEIVGGVKAISGIGYSAISTYFSKDGNVPATSPPADSPLNSKAARNTANDGLIIIRQIPQLINSISQEAITIKAHFKAHQSPITYAKFNPNCTLLFTASSNATAFSIWSCLKSPVCVYRLDRGFTPAVISDISFSEDSKWVSVSTLRGTVHVYQIHPLVTPAHKTTVLQSTSRWKTASIRMKFIPMEKKDALFRQGMISVSPDGTMTQSCLEFGFVDTHGLLERYSHQKILAAYAPALAGMDVDTPKSEMVRECIKISVIEYLEWKLFGVKLKKNAEIVEATRKREEKEWIKEIELEPYDTGRWSGNAAIAFECYEEDGDLQIVVSQQPDYSDLPRTREKKVKVESLVPFAGDGMESNSPSPFLEMGKEGVAAQGIAQAMGSKLEFEDAMKDQRFRTLSFEDAFYIDANDFYPQTTFSDDEAISISSSITAQHADQARSVTNSIASSVWRKLFHDSNQAQPSNEVDGFVKNKSSESGIEKSNSGSPGDVFAFDDFEELLTGQVHVEINNEDAKTQDHLDEHTKNNLQGAGSESSSENDSENDNESEVNEAVEDGDVTDEEEEAENDEVSNQEDDATEEGGGWLGGFLDYQRTRHQQMLQHKLQTILADAMDEGIVSPAGLEEREWRRSREGSSEGLVMRSPPRSPPSAVKEGELSEEEIASWKLKNKVD